MRSQQNNVQKLFHDSVNKVLKQTLQYSLNQIIKRSLSEEFNMQIFDRWGNLIFESNNANQGWDGYDRNGRILPAGVYVYKLTLRLSDGQRTTQIGDITMIR